MCVCVGGGGGLVIRAHVKLTLMGESSLTVLELHEDDPTGYDKAIDDKDFSFLERGYEIKTRIHVF